MEESSNTELISIYIWLNPDLDRFTEAVVLEKNPDAALCENPQCADCVSTAYLNVFVEKHVDPERTIFFQSTAMLILEATKSDILKYAKIEEVHLLVYYRHRIAEEASLSFPSASE